MAYPPPPYADALCGTPLCGEAICGAWWAYAPQGGELLGGFPPDVTTLDGDVVPEAGLKLGAFPPSFVGQAEVPQAGLLLGGVAPAIALGMLIDVPAAGLLFGAPLPGLKIDSTLVPLPAGLLLGGQVPFRAGQQYLEPTECEPMALDDADCVPHALAEDTELVLALDGSECL